MKVEKVKFITRQMLRDNPDKIFLFGDNLKGTGLGGQAAECRGEFNAIGIPTKNSPSMSKGSFFSDQHFKWNRLVIDYRFSCIPRACKAVVIPKDGIGTGRAKLAEKAPKTFKYIQQKLKELEK